MDLRQLRYFVALADERHFGRAAERLHMAQPPLTRAIRGLEDDIGAALFLRTPRGVELTEAGRALLDEAPQILAMVRRAEDKAQRAGAGMLGTIDIGIYSAALLNTIPRVLSAFRRERPQVRIRLHNLTKAQQIQALHERRIAMAFNRLVPEEPGIAVEVILREPVRVALHESHPLATRRAIPITALADQPMVLYPNVPMPGLAQQVMQAFQAEGVKLRVEQEVEDVYTAIALVAGGFGCCITTASAASLQPPGVVYRPLRSTHLRDIDLACLYRQGDDSPVLKALLKVVRAQRR
ncbi:LysR family transcriptional regulator [Ramlibacter sp. AW1]|uniref:LysR family transcriptional regulator n=1 Tax=Ramlibacter aurantiacus TaxID=2801330 RepID=A0A936ZUU6_9BURK|nr:LysR family transcriptional regulator [Ramlibacter aurantiacus]MBL0422996.1 LysR family transcriptional regulator [Ramlibacter aurantiacus]